MTGLDFDPSLLYQARKFITAANVHYVNTCILCYESSAAHSETRQRYEHLLREFVGLQKRLIAARCNAELVRSRSNRARTASASLNAKIEKLRNAVLQK
jgi:hypothetical protein